MVQHLGIKLHKGDLTKFGYHASLTPRKRDAALARAVKEYGTTGVKRKLNIIAVYDKRTRPKVAATFRADEHKL